MMSRNPRPTTSTPVGTPCDSQAVYDNRPTISGEPDGSARPIHGYHTLPDKTLTPLHVIMGLIVARDGTIYATTIYPFTLLRIAPVS